MQTSLAEKVIVVCCKKLIKTQYYCRTLAKEREYQKIFSTFCLINLIITKFIKIGYCFIFMLPSLTKLLLVKESVIAR